MKYRKLMLVTFLLLAILTIGAVSASDNTTDDIVAANDVAEVDNDLSSSDDVLKESSKTFADLNNTINANEDKEIYLDGNYICDDESDFIEGIAISRSVTINGNGYTIDGNYAARIFNVTDDNSTVVFKNIVFINGNAAGFGGAIYGNIVDNTEVINCTFIGNSAKNGGAIAGATVKDSIFSENTATDNGGAIYFGVVENCIFNDNTADNGGAIFYAEIAKSTFTDNYAKTDGGAIYGAFVCEDCNFTQNSAGFYGGAIYGAEDVKNSVFTENSAICGGALDSGNAFNCTFIGNTADDYGGAMYSYENHTATDCKFIDNSAKSGGAARGIDATDCEFTGNFASEYGGALYESTAVGCDFEDNTADIDGDDFYTLADEPDVEITSEVYFEDSYVSLVRYYFPKNATGSISIYIDGAEDAAYSSEITTGEWVSIYADELEGFDFVPGSYDIEVVYPGDDNYGKSTWQSTLEVTDEEDEPVSADYNITFSEDHFFNQEVVKGRGTYDASFEFPISAEGNVTVYIDDEYYGVEDVDLGDVFIEIETANLSLGKHDVRFVYSGDDYFKSSTAYDSFNVTHIRFGVPYVLMPDSTGVSAYAALTVLPYDATGEVKLILDGAEKAAEAIDEGSVVYYLPDYVPYGNHTLTLAYQNGNYPSASKTFDVECLIVGSQVDPDLSLTVIDVNFGETATVNVLMNETFNGNVLVSIDNSNYTVNIVNGKGSKAVSGLDAGNYKVEVTFGGDDNFISASASASLNVNALNISDVNIALSKTAFTYNAKVQKPTVTLSNGVVLTEGVDYTLQWSTASPKNVATYTVTVTGIGNYAGTTKATFKINKAANPLAVKAKTANVKFSAVKKKAQTLAVSKVVKFSKKGQGTLTYAKVSGNKKITVNKKTGKVTVAKGLKKGTYKVKVKIKAKGNANYKASAYKAVTFKIVIK